MNITIIGTGNVGGALASQWAKAGHTISLGVRDLNNFKGKDLTALPNITAYTITEAGQQSDVILIAAAPQHTLSILEALGDVSGKVIIDAMNSIRTRPEGFANSFEAILKLAPHAEAVKCFNTTGYENMQNPNYNGVPIDLFMAGNSTNAKTIARQLALDAGFGECYDFGGNDRAALLEQFALCWINLAIMQGHGRNMAFKVLKR